MPSAKRKPASRNSASKAISLGGASLRETNQSAKSRWSASIEVNHLMLYWHRSISQRWKSSVQAAELGSGIVRESSSETVTDNPETAAKSETKRNASSARLTLSFWFFDTSIAILSVTSVTTQHPYGFEPPFYPSHFTFVTLLKILFLSMFMWVVSHVMDNFALKKGTSPNSERTPAQALRERIPLR